MTEQRARITLGLVVLWCLLLASSINAQTTGASVSGTVTDPSGAIIPGATVSATNSATGISQATVTNTSGAYNIPNLQPGTYQVTVNAQGFPQYITKGLVLEVGAQQQINFALRIGNVEQKIDVSGIASSVDLVGSTVKPVVDSKTIVELPLNGRDWTQLANLQPGVAPMRSQPVVTVSNQRANRGIGAQITISGARPQENNYRVDGISINDYSNGGPGGVIGANLGVDAIQEFSVVTSNATADYGKTAGGVINAVTREGSNKFHGSVYEFLRNSALDTRNEFDKPGQIAPFRRNQFGVAVGGPIIRDRTFFFADYEGLRQYQSTNVSSVVPSVAARQGRLANGTTVTVDPKIVPYLAFYPLPSTPTAGDTGTFLFSAPQTTDENYVTARGDHKMSEADSLTASYFLDRGTLIAPDPFDVKNLGNLARRQLATVGESHIFNPQLLNFARFGYSRVVSIAPSTVNAINPAAGDPNLGFVPGHAVGLINVGGLSNFTGGLGAVGQYSFHYNSYQFYDDVNWTPGKNTIAIGFAFERLQNNQLGLVYPNGFFTFTNLTSFLTNQPTTFTAQLSQFILPRDLRQSVFGAYFEDNYHLFPTLSLNFGLRYEPSSVPTETAGRLAALRSLGDTQPHLGSPYFSNPTFKNLAPRVGFSWDPFGTGKTAFRGAFGIYDALPLNYLFEGLSILTAPFTEQVSTGTLAQGTFPTLAFSQLANATNLRYSYIQPNPPRNYVEQWNLNVQRDLGGNFTLQAGYYGSHGVHLPYREDDINTVQPISTSGGYFFPTPRGSGSRLNPALGQISSLLWTGGSNYNALQTQITKRLSHRIQMQGSYTWGKSIDDGSSST
ncbi:MAG TPA: carboxypeptidase regulatory-like domain-containing protein, partial [Terriglobales bacterium]|nr:carboxypeptidase regulatory-like domain-containing protein [Terriglobales bacterium]